MLEIHKRYKAHIVVKGFQQKKGADFDKIFAPVVKMSIATSMDLEVEQLDVKMTFLVENQAQLGL